MSRIVRLHYEDEYKIIELPTNFEEFRKLCGKEFEYQHDSQAVRYFFIPYFEDKIQIAKDNFKNGIQELLEILIETDFPKKEYLLDSETEQLDQFSSILVTPDKKDSIISSNGSITVTIKNNGRCQWPLPLSLTPLKSSTIFSSDYSINQRVYPQDSISLNINLLELKLKPLGDYVLSMQLRKGNIFFGDIFKFHFSKTK